MEFFCFFVVSLKEKGDGGFFFRFFSAQQKKNHRDCKEVERQRWVQTEKQIREQCEHLAIEMRVFVKTRLRMDIIPILEQHLKDLNAVIPTKEEDAVHEKRLLQLARIFRGVLADHDISFGGSL